MSGPLAILGASTEDPTVKLVIGAIVAVFWIIAQIAGAVSKKKDKSLPPSRPRQTTVDQPPVPRPTRQPQAKRQKPQPAVRRQPPPLRQPGVTTFATPTPQIQPVVRGAAGTRRAEQALAAAASTATPAANKTLSQGQMVRALLMPRNLRKAYIVNEILQPPVSMR